MKRDASALLRRPCPRAALSGSEPAAAAVAPPAGAVGEADPPLGIGGDGKPFAVVAGAVEGGISCAGVFCVAKGSPMGGGGPTPNKSAAARCAAIAR